jgi:RimJ/RimL family protein N-acetyltransferase
MKLRLQNINTILEPVEINDAEFICELRNDPSIQKYLSNSNMVSIQDQVEWIKWNDDKKDGFYFKIIEKNTQLPVGTISIYNVDENENCAEFGRYICTHPVQAVEAELMILSLGFNMMRLRMIYCRTVVDNKSVWNQHYKFGFCDVGFENFEAKNLLLKRQELTKSQFTDFDYSKIINTIKRFEK